MDGKKVTFDEYTRPKHKSELDRFIGLCQTCLIEATLAEQYTNTPEKIAEANQARRCRRQVASQAQSALRGAAHIVKSKGEDPKPLFALAKMLVFSSVDELKEAIFQAEIVAEAAKLEVVPMANPGEREATAVKAIRLEEAATVAFIESESPTPVTDPLEAMHDEMKLRKAKDIEIAEAFYNSRSKLAQNELHNKHGSKEDVLKYFVRRCTNLRSKRKREASKSPA
ncbi:hypothetical protein [Rosistilla oblonga]|uniref:hypothetical protein n=1 Tax=Rosistilla oblonga TaxID=2527990 RepID=UPI003A97D0CC